MSRMQPTGLVVAARRARRLAFQMTGSKNSQSTMNIDGIRMPLPFHERHVEAWKPLVAQLLQPVYLYL